MKRSWIVLSIFFFSIVLHAFSQQDSIVWLPRSLDLKLSFAPSYILSSSQGGTDPAVFPALAQAQTFQADLIWDGFIAAKFGYAYQNFGTGYNASIGNTTIFTGESTLQMHALQAAVGQSQYFNLNKAKDDYALVITPWAGVRAGQARALWAENNQLRVEELDTTLNGFHSAAIFTGDSLNGYTFQKLEAASQLQIQLLISLAMELRILKRFHVGLEPFFAQGLQPLYRQNVFFFDPSVPIAGNQRLFSRGTNYGVHFSIRCALWQEEN